MKKAKRILTILLISMMATVFLIGCGETERETSTSQSSDTSASDSDTSTSDSDTSTSDSDTSASDSDTSTVDSDASAFDTYTIIFDSDGGRKVQNQVKQENELLEEPNLSYKIVYNDGEYELEGWYFGEIKWDFDTMTVKGDMVLKARWNKVEDYPKPEI